MAMVIVINEKLTATQIEKQVAAQHKKEETLLVLPVAHSTKPLIDDLERTLQQKYKSVVVMRGPRQTTYSIK